MMKLAREEIDTSILESSSTGIAIFNATGGNVAIWLANLPLSLRVQTTLILVSPQQFDHYDDDCRFR